MKSDKEEEFFPSTSSAMEADLNESKPESSNLRCTEELDEQPENQLNTSLNLGATPRSLDDDLKPDDSSPGGGVQAEENNGVTITPQRPRSKTSHSNKHLNSNNNGNNNNNTPEDSRVARPPVDPKGRNQMLPRYWPRITDQEIQQITSGDSKSVITPLFEKILSASDAGRIGRLVLPKACAEAYFPPISHAEGLPLKINDITGREWQFQFRFWPNNNSRMYVLEGVTPCIQAMRLQAGDTVTFSRLEPEDKLIMGYRKAQDGGGGGGGGGDGESPPQRLGSSSEYKTPRSSREAALCSSSDKRRNRSLGGKTKRLRIDSDDSQDLKASWEEAQELLRPPPGATPSFVDIDGHQFEEYEEPPVLTKKTVTRTKASGEKDRWVQCDDCSKFRKVPLDVCLHTRWTCVDNIWDPKRASCSVAKELSNEEMEQLSDILAAAEKEKKESEAAAMEELAAATEMGDDKNKPPVATCPAATTRHPRHRPGCTCIVCIQPPSGKGPKHKPTCVCNVCMTVKRRFKTLMLRRKKRQSEREAERAAQKQKKTHTQAQTPSGKDDHHYHHGEGAMGTPTRTPTRSSAAAAAAAATSNSPDGAGKWKENGKGVNTHQRERSPIGQVQMTERGKVFPFPGGLFPGAAGGSNSNGGFLAGGGETNAGDEEMKEIDLNSQPGEREDPGSSRMSMVKLLQDAAMPLDMYLKQQGMASLVASSGAPLFAGSLGDSSQQAKDSQQATSG